MILTQKIKLFPTLDTQQILWSISHLCKDLWNAALEQRRDRKSWGKVNVYTQKAELPLLKKEFPEYKHPSSQVLQNVLFSLDRAYKQFFTKQQLGAHEARPPKFKSYKQFFTQEYSQEKTAFEVNENRLGLAYGRSKKDWMSIPFSGELKGKAKTVQVKKEGKHFFACFTVEVEEADKKTTGEVIYFDPGCKTALTGIKSTGEWIEYDFNPLRKLNRSTYLKIDHWLSIRDTKKKGAWKWRKYHQKIKHGFQKIRERTKSYLHTLAKQLLEDHPDVKEFQIGNWKKQETLAQTENAFVNKRINRSVQNNHPLETFIGFLSYKAKLKGQEVLRFDERGSTRTCVNCDYKHQEGIEPTQRVFRCISCGFAYSRDHHSCLNFVKKYNPALWQRLSGAFPDRRTRTSLHPFSFKPQRLSRRILITGCSSLQ